MTKTDLSYKTPFDIAIAVGALALVQHNAEAMRIADELSDAVCRSAWRPLKAGEFDRRLAAAVVAFKEMTA